MKRSLAHPCQRRGLTGLAYPRAESLHRCASFAQCLHHQPFGGETGVGAHVGQGDLRPQEGLHSPVGSGVATSDMFQYAACTAFPPQRAGRSSCMRQRGEDSAVSLQDPPVIGSKSISYGATTMRGLTDM